MRTLSKPLDNPKHIFLNCISIIADEDLKERLEKSSDDVANAAVVYESKIAVHKLFTIPRNKSTKGNKNIRILGKITINEMKDVYTSYFARRGSRGRDLYDKILAMPKHSKCPYCSHRQVSTVDHYLSKAYFPLLSVVPANLVPCCKDCNFSIGSSYPKKAEDELLHPYFDNVESELWLKARVERTSPVSLNFYVYRPEGWDELLKDRVQNHFNSLSLNLLYSAEAANELANLNYQLIKLLAAGGHKAVTEMLIETSQSRRKASINSWQTAMYTALAEDVWFCSGGFNF